MHTYLIGGKNYASIQGITASQTGGNFNDVQEDYICKRQNAETKDSGSRLKAGFIKNTNTFTGKNTYAKRHDGVQTCFVYLQCENVVYCYLVLICQNQQNSVINYLLPGLVVLEKIGIPSIVSEPKISKLNIF